MAVPAPLNGAGPPTGDGYAYPAQPAPPTASGSASAEPSAPSKKKRPSRAAAAFLPDDDPDGIARRVSFIPFRAGSGRPDEAADHSSDALWLPLFSPRGTRPARSATPTSCTRTRRRSPRPASLATRSRTTPRSPAVTGTGSRPRPRLALMTRPSSRTRRGTASCAQRRTSGASPSKATSSPYTPRSNSSRLTLGATSVAARSRPPRALSR